MWIEMLKNHIENEKMNLLQNDVDASVIKNAGMPRAER